MAERPLHVLVIPQGRDDLTGAYIECPYAGLITGVPNEQGRREDCAYLQQCPCDSEFNDEQIRFEKEYDDDLEVIDWLEGWDNTTTAVGHRITLSNPKIPVTYPSHKTCPHTGLEHYIWEGEVMTKTGPCGVVDEFDLLRTETMEHLGEPGPGRHPVRYSWDEDGIELELA